MLHEPHILYELSRTLKINEIKAKNNDNDMLQNIDVDNMTRNKY